MTILKRARHEENGGLFLYLNLSFSSWRVRATEGKTAMAKSKSGNPDRLSLRLERTRESIRVSLNLLSQGRVELASAFLIGADALIERDLREVAR